MIEANRELHPSEKAILPYFEFGHLPAELRPYSEPFYRLARELVNTLPASAETTVALRKLLESKDCSVRVGVSQRNPAAL